MNTVAVFIISHVTVRLGFMLFVIRTLFQGLRNPVVCQDGMRHKVNVFSGVSFIRAVVQVIVLM